MTGRTVTVLNLVCRVGSMASFAVGVAGFASGRLDTLEATFYLVFSIALHLIAIDE